MDWEMVRKAANTLNRIPVSIRKIAGVYNYKPEFQSEASQEIGDGVVGELLSRAFERGLLQIYFVSPDYMSGLQRGLERSSSALVLTPQICERAILESCSIALLLHSNDMLAKERIVHILNLELSDHTQRLKFAREVQNESGIDVNDEIDYSCRCIESLREQAKECEVREKLDKHSKFIGFEPGIFKVSDRIYSVLKNRYNYSKLSSVAHADMFGVLGEVTINKSELGATVIPDADPARSTNLIHRVVDLFAYTCWTSFKLYGWDMDMLKLILECEYNRAEFNEESRFWRQST